MITEIENNVFPKMGIEQHVYLLSSFNFCLSTVMLLSVKNMFFFIPFLLFCCFIYKIYMLQEIHTQKVKAYKINNKPKIEFNINTAFDFKNYKTH